MDYRHTQFGWVIVGTSVVPLLLLAAVGVATSLPGLVLFAGGLLLLIALLFGSLTISVDAETLRLHFGVGLIRKSFPLDQIRQFAHMRTRWFHGWGIRYAPSGVIYNVSGFDAIELTLKDGRRVRLGTDEPRALLAALGAKLGTPAALTTEEKQRSKALAKKNVAIILAIAFGIAGLIGAMSYLEEQPPRVALEHERLLVDSFLYGAELSFADLQELRLIERIPRVWLRINGYALGGTLRGHFRLEELGDGQLFIEAGHPPYVLARTHAEYVIFNFESAEHTRRRFLDICAIAPRCSPVAAGARGDTASQGAAGQNGERP